MRHDRADRCVVNVYLTEEGRDISHTLVSSVEHFEQSIKRGFSEGELDRFLAQLQQIITNVSEIGPGLGDRFGLLPNDGAWSDEGTNEREKKNDDSCYYP